MLGGPGEPCVLCCCGRVVVVSAAALHGTLHLSHFPNSEVQGVSLVVLRGKGCVSLVA